MKVIAQQWTCLIASGCVLFFSASLRGETNPAFPSLQAAAPQQQAAPQTPDESNASAAPPSPLSPPAWQTDHEEAVKLAREGHPDKAVIVLRQLYEGHGDDVGITRDYLLVSNWAHHDGDVIRIFKSVEKQDQPDFVLKAVGGSYRNLHRYNDALAIYRRGHKQFPDDADFVIGEIRTLADLKRFAQTVTLAETDLREHGDRLNVLLAAGNAASRGGKTYDALNDYVRAADIAPKNREAVRGVVLMTNQAGVAQVALEKLYKHQSLFNSDEQRRIEGDEAAALARWGVLEPSSESERNAATDQAIARLDMLIARWSREGFAAHKNVLRARFDRIVALRNRTRMQDVVEEYQKLTDEKVELPAYALSSVAEAYLYLREPEKARDLYLEVLKTQPDNFDVEAQLFFAYVECDDFDHAYALIDKLDREEPLWLPLRGSPTPLPNPNRQKADLFAGDARMFGGELEDANQRFDAIADAAPYDARDQHALGNIYLARGLPRRARLHFEIGENIEWGRELHNESGIALADLDLQNFPANEAETGDLMQRFPEQLEAQRDDRLLQVHNMAELQVRGGYGFSPGGSAINGRTYDVETVFYSPPIDYNWRLFAGGMYLHGDEPNNEGSVGYDRALAGVEYRDGGVTADLAPTYNHYHSTERIGAEGNLSWSLNDTWSLFGGGELFTRDTPSRALNAGITVNKMQIGTEWRENESRSDRLAAFVMPFSDGNTQYGLTNNYMERLYVDPHFTIDGLFDLASSHSTGDENRRYYNPSFDLLGVAGARATQILYRHYETVYQHALTIMPGAYWEQHFGADSAVSVRYEHRLLMNDVFDIGVGINYMRRPYDGVSENDVSLSFDLTQRF